ncbi:hypothetical protein BT93_J1424 [Corymbia citriodora subsp. variegata]|nr:hypothetical protein BT93_J1424 [Corymbia citriodora subsp. variegata]
MGDGEHDFMPDKPRPGCHGMAKMHMTFFWGTNSEILFSGWPGAQSGLYALALLFVFALCVLVEWLSHCRGHLLPAKPGVAAKVVRSLLHALRMGLAYLAMLALMSFNGGVFLAAVAGHALGFMVFAKPEKERLPQVGKAATANLSGPPQVGKAATADLSGPPQVSYTSC